LSFCALLALLHEDAHMAMPPTPSCLHDAEAAAKVPEGSEQCAPMFALIYMESALFLHAIPAITPVHARG